MKKKILVIAVIATLIMLLTACGNVGDYSGEATVTYNFDKVYDNIEISCPSADIQKIDSKTYTLSFKKTAPVEVVISAEKCENKVLQYKTSDLKKGTITEDIILEAVKYTFELNIDDKQNVNPTIVGGKYNLEKRDKGLYFIKSDNRIEEDLEISFGKDFYNITVSKYEIKYSLGTYGNMVSTIKPIKKVENKVLIISDINIRLINIEDVSKTYQINKTSKDVLIEKANYAVELDDLTIIDFIYKDKITTDSINFKCNSIELKGLSNDSLQINSTGLDSKIILEEEYGNNGTYKRFIKSLEPFYDGQIVLYEEYGNDKPIQKYLKITQQTIDSGKLDVNDESLVYDYESAKNGINQNTAIKFNFVDYKGQVLPNDAYFSYYDEEYTNKEFYLVKNKKSMPISYNELLLRYPSIQFKSTINDGSVDELIRLKDRINIVDYVTWNLAKLQKELSKPLTEVTINIPTVKLKNIKVVPVDIDTNKAIEIEESYQNNWINQIDEEVGKLFIDTQYLLEHDYCIMDKKVKDNSFYYVDKLYNDGSNEIKIYVQKNKRVKLNFTNKELLQSYDLQWERGFYCVSNSLNKKYDINSISSNYEELFFNYNDKDLGKTYEYIAKIEMFSPMANEYDGIKFVITVPENGFSENQIDVTLQLIPNEWV